MKKIALVFCLVFTAGCANKITLLRSQIHTGMTTTQVWKLYGCDYSDPNTYETCTKFSKSLKIIDEKSQGDCTAITYRYWLYDSDKKNIFGQLDPSARKPYLLTFQSCRLANYDAVQTEKKRRLDNYKRKIENNSDLQEKLVVFCEEQGLDPEDRDIIIEALALSFYKDSPLPQCTTDMTLVKITIDQATIRYRQNQRAMSGIKSQLRTNQGHLQQIQQQQDWMQMQQFQQNSLNEFHRLNNLP